uniref:Uncharacterized protein n=1 Tax=Cacopsylla melanoneura TaxID=428564 RepID=A0A8D8MB71_9HEMI
MLLSFFIFYFIGKTMSSIQKQQQYIILNINYQNNHTPSLPAKKTNSPLARLSSPPPSIIALARNISLISFSRCRRERSISALDSLLKCVPPYALLYRVIHNCTSKLRPQYPEAKWRKNIPLT